MDLMNCAAFLREHDGYLLVTHLRPDGDTLGSAAALCNALRRLGKTAFLYVNPQVTERYRPMVAPYFAPADFVPQTVVAVDLADQALFPQGFSAPVDLCIDHHPSNSGYAAQTLLREEKAACGEIVLELIEALCGAPNIQEANLLYTAVSTDTGCFAYANTKADTFHAAARLLEAGAENARLNQLLFRKVSAARLKLEGMIYNSLRCERNGEVVIATVTLDMLCHAGATENDCDDLASLAGRVEGGLISATIREMEGGGCKVSVRSGPEINASAVCAKFGGGGHAMAAGCSLQMGPEETAEAILRAIDEVRQ